MRAPATVYSVCIAQVGICRVYTRGIFVLILHVRLYQRWVYYTRVGSYVYYAKRPVSNTAAMGVCANGRTWATPRWWSTDQVGLGLDGAREARQASLNSMGGAEIGRNAIFAQHV